MINGVGLRTPRGSGTNGYVQRSLANLPPKKVVNRNNESYSISRPKTKTDPEILLHEKKREIELKLLELRNTLKNSMTLEEIEDEIAKQRQFMFKNLNDVILNINKNEHIMADLKSKQMDNLQRVLKINPNPNNSDSNNNNVTNRDNKEDNSDNYKEDKQKEDDDDELLRVRRKRREHSRTRHSPTYSRSDSPNSYSSSNSPSRYSSSRSDSISDYSRSESYYSNSSRSSSHSRSRSRHNTKRDYKDKHKDKRRDRSSSSSSSSSSSYFRKRRNKK